MLLTSVAVVLLAVVYVVHVHIWKIKARCDIIKKEGKKKEKTTSKNDVHSKISGLCLPYLLKY